jgi:ABC-type dipeptide/oligopeptide/nickel transport system ATPase subunit
MFSVELDNCNNIVSAKISLLKNRLNIRYAMNGTGKSTIAKAIELLSKNESLSVLKPFDGEIEPKVSVSSNSEGINKVLLFNEEFVNTIIFKESEVIQNAFDVFIKTPEYEERQQSINEKLKEINIDTSLNPDLHRLMSVGQAVLGKFTVTKTDDLKQIGLIKSLTSSENIFKLPEPIKKYQPLMDKEYNVDWVGWKNDGCKYDDNSICPFCTENLGKEYENEKKIFTSAYTKSNVKNIKEMVSYFDDVKEYMEESKSEILYKCIKETSDEATINLWVKRFYDDLKYLVDKIKKVIEFNSYKVKSEDISKLDEQLKGLIIDSTVLYIFNNTKVINVITSINNKIELVLKETEALKHAIGQLKGLIGSATKKAVTDINDFLQKSDINYSLEIRHESESITKTILKYKSKIKDYIQVENIKLHLSWGERNAFALVLFMHYAISHKPDIIILDDPISSFDSNKKYAIINRLFMNYPNHKSFYKKTVLMLTHDFQPVIDFVVNNKPNGENVSAYFLKNTEGVLSEIEITETDIKSLPILLSENASNNSLNKVHRITSLRKLLEHTKKNHSQDMGYNLLSCLLHGKENPTYYNGSPIKSEDILAGEELVKTFISEFSYSKFKKNVFNKDELIALYKTEQNTYYQLQVFRVILTVLNLRSKIVDDPLLKYIDEQFHVENDYIFYLDLNKYDIVPDFVKPKCIEFLTKEKVL